MAPRALPLPSSGALWVGNLVLASLPFAAAPAFILLAELRGAQRLSGWPYLAAATAALLIGALLTRGGEHLLSASLRRLLSCAVFAAAPVAFAAVPPGDALALCAALGALAGALAGPDLAALMRGLRQRASTDDVDRPPARLPVLALVGAALTLLALPAARPYFGAGRTMMLAGLLVLSWSLFLFRVESGRGSVARSLAAFGLAVGGAAAVLAVNAERLRFPIPVALSGLSRYVEPVEELAPGAWLWVTGLEDAAIVQVQTADRFLVYEAAEEIRVAESLIHPAAGLWAPRRALLLGDESGGATREVLKYASVERVVRVSFFPGLTAAFREHPILRRAHGGALDDPRVVHRELAPGADIAAALAGDGRFELIVVAAPAPVAALKWLLGPAGRRFYLSHLAPGGALVRRLFSLVEPPLFSWCFVQESAEAGWTTHAYSVVRPMSSSDQILIEVSSPALFRAGEIAPPRVATRFLTPKAMRRMSAFGHDERFLEQERTAPCADELGSPQ